MVKQIDPLVDLVAQHDEKYDAMMTDLFMNSLNRIDPQLAEKIVSLLNLEDSLKRNLLVALVKRFIHSLGFEFMNMRNTLFLWDQMIMRVYPMGIEIYLVMSITFLCLKEEILQVTTWDQLLEVYYHDTKLIGFNEFSKLYKEKFSGFPFYYPVYEQIDTTDILYSDNEETQEVEKSQVVDLSKKPSSKPKQPKVYSSLVKKPNIEEELEQIKSLDPRIEKALQENVKDERAVLKQHIGMVPFVNINEEEQDELEDL